jgi:hypothetical protein
MSYQRLFQYPRIHVIVEIQDDVVRKPHTLKCHAVTGKETKLTCIKQASVFIVPFGIFSE